MPQRAIRTSVTFLKIGSPRCLVPALALFTPPTILVPYSIAFSVWNVACLPVMPKSQRFHHHFLPWQITLVSLLMNTYGLLANLYRTVRRSGDTRRAASILKILERQRQCKYYIPIRCCHCLAYLSVIHYISYNIHHIA